MFKQLIKSMTLDKDYPARALMIDVYTRILNGELYDSLPYFFWQEYDAMGKYIPLHRRQPSVRYPLCKIVVDESVSLLFGSDHFPNIASNDESLATRLDDVIKYAYIQKTMIEAATTGSAGSVAIILRIIEGQLDFEVLSTQYLTPTFDTANPYKLTKLTEKYKVSGKDLVAMGYLIDSEQENYWFMREWDELQERYYLPFKNNGTPKIDKDKTFDHELGFVPALWIKNLPKAGFKGRREIDGACTFSPAIDTNIEIDYQLSQGGRALKYAGDPLVIFKVEDDLALANNAIDVSGDVNSAKRLVKSASNAFVLGKEDDAKLLEINGRASEAVKEYVRMLRELALESIHGNRSNADKVNAAQSGIAMQAMNQPLVWLADKLRIYYGDCGLVPLLKMIVQASQKKEIIINGQPIGKLNANATISLKWPHWYPNTPEDKFKISNALKTLRDNGNLSQETAVKYIADDYGILKADEEIKRIEVDQQKIINQQPQVKEQINV